MKKVLLIVLVLFLVLLSLSACNSYTPPLSVTSKETIKPTTKPYTVGVTSENFELLKVGMSIDEVASMLGKGSLDAESGSIKNYRYENSSTGVAIEIMFHDGKLKTKMIFD